VANGLVFASLGGLVAGYVGPRMDLVCGIVLALVIALGAMISMMSRPGAGALWTQTAALLLFAPASLAGDWTAEEAGDALVKPFILEVPMHSVSADPGTQSIRQNDLEFWQAPAQTRQKCGRIFSDGVDFLTQMSDARCK
jgi:hypothetical protein